MPSAPKKARRGLKLLGRSDATFPEEPSASTLETFENRFPERGMVVTFDCTDFTSLCPITGQPDFARFSIQYVPEALCLETKSLKFYLASYRHTRSFNEEIANLILNDLVAACQPRWMQVVGEFAARGGIALSVRVTHDDEGWEELGEEQST